jgi:hypothetical protein
MSRGEGWLDEAVTRWNQFTSRVCLAESQRTMGLMINADGF